MADDNDKSPLTRRQVLGGMATIGVAGAVGAGTWAQYNDQETAGPINVDAGTMNLVVDTPASRNVEVEPLGGPAQGFSETFDVSNTGNITGNDLSLYLDQVSSGEGLNPEPETDTDGNGELDEQLEVRAWVTKGNGTENYFFGGSDSWEDYNSAKGEDNASRQKIVLQPGEQNSFTIEGRMKDLPGNENNAAMGDTLSFDAVVTLHQQNTA